MNDRDCALLFFIRNQVFDKYFFILTLLQSCYIILIIINELNLL